MLVSVAVITYNSSKYVIETLDSVYSQTYPEIELIISDDCSTDYTIAICRDWLRRHQDRFVRAIITKTPYNGGICYNYNYALQEAQGDYIKYIAGDDILKKNCIEFYVKEARKNINIYLWYSAIDIIDGQSVYIGTEYCKLENASPQKQFKNMLLNHYSLYGSSMFVHRSLLLTLNGFDERFSMIEDWPISMKFLKFGHPIGILSDSLVQWRSYEKNVSKVNMVFIKSLDEAIYYYSRYLLRYGLLLHWYNEFVFHYINKYSNKGFLFRFVGYMLRVFDILHFKRKLSTRIK